MVALSCSVQPGRHPRPSFGTGGRVVNPRAQVATPRGHAQADGKIIKVAGTAYIVAQALPGGPVQRTISLDAGFGDGGFSVAAFPGADGVRRGRQPDGTVMPPEQHSWNSFRVARFTSAGVLSDWFVGDWPATSAVDCSSTGRRPVAAGSPCGPSA